MPAFALVKDAVRRARIALLEALVHLNSRFFLAVGTRPGRAADLGVVANVASRGELAADNG